jgi:hypothetical protein
MDKLPLDDPRWMTLEAAVIELNGWFGHSGLTVQYLERDLAADKLGSMHRDLTGAWLLEAAFWANHSINVSGPLVILHRTSEPLRREDIWAQYVRDHQAGHVYYVWRPHFDRLYGGAPAEHDEPLLPIDRAEAVLRYLYQTKAQMPRSLKAATKAVDDPCEKWGWQLVKSPDTVHRAAEKIGYRAPRKPPPRKRKRK